MVILKQIHRVVKKYSNLCVLKGGTQMNGQYRWVYNKTKSSYYILVIALIIIIQGGICDTGERVSVTLKREFMEKALNSEEMTTEEKTYFQNLLGQFSRVVKRFTEDMLMILVILIMPGWKQLYFTFMMMVQYLKELSQKLVMMPQRFNGCHRFKIKTLRQS